MNKTYQRKRLAELATLKDTLKEKYKDEIPEVKCINDEILLFCRYYVDELENYIARRKNEWYSSPIPQQQELTESLLSKIPIVKEKVTKITKELRGEMHTAATAPRYIASGILAYVVKLDMGITNPSTLNGPAAAAAAAGTRYLLSMHEIASRVTKTSEVSMRNNMRLIEDYIRQNRIEGSII